MSDAVDLAPLRQEAADLHRFVGSISRLCGDRREDYPVFSEAASFFFKYVHSLGLQTQKFLEEFPQDFLETEEAVIALSKRQKLGTLRDAWERLHEYVKPALDSDSLNLPMPLIEAFEQMVRDVEDWSDFRFVYFHTTEANYLQVPPERAKDIADQIAAEVGGEQFPNTIGLVGIPYSQANAFLLNCLLPHEYAHFLYSQAASFDVELHIDAALDRFADEQGIDNQDIISYRRDTLERWVIETFCDLVALWFLGPAFSFAYAELTGASVSLGRDLTDSMELFEFSTTYPADAARFHIHVEALKRIGWWNELSHNRSAPVQVLKAFEHWSDLFYAQIPLHEDDQNPNEPFIELYKELAVWLIEYVETLLGTRSEDVQEYRSQFPVIASYLERAVVPSTIIMEGAVHPRVPVLVNSAYTFKLCEMDRLLRRIECRDSTSVKDLSEITERLELWMLKALEDNKLLTGQQIHGGSS